MTTATPATLTLARRLIALEVARDPADGLAGVGGTCERLRATLSKLTGVAGFRSLLSRAVALATTEVPWLDAVQVGADGSLDGFEAAGRQQGADQSAKAGVLVVAQLLGLLVTFIGEPLTLGLVRDAWPDAPLDEANRTAGGRP